MNGKGSLIVFSLGMVLCIVYFSIYGFSFVKSVRWGQYLGVMFVAYCLLTEIVTL